MTISIAALRALSATFVWSVKDVESRELLEKL